MKAYAELDRVRNLFYEELNKFNQKLAIHELNKKFHENQNKLSIIISNRKHVVFEQLKLPLGEIK